MCDTVCALHDGRTLFGKNSDRPVGEVQLIEPYGRRDAGGTIRTQYLTIDDTGANALLGSRPAWLWGLEHGVNEHRVAIGNERVFTTDDPAAAPDALIGMDLVRLGLERADSADHAIDIMTALLESHGQGGVADSAHDEAYFSSFLVADPTAAWVLETSGRTWAAKPVQVGAAISNRVALDAGWTRASSDVEPGQAFAERIDPASWPAASDIRLACTLPAVTGDGRIEDPRAMAALLRHHGTMPWGRPGGDPQEVSPLPQPTLGPNAEGFSVCMHLRGNQTTAASMICELPIDSAEPLRAWVALGSPCVSVYVPVFPPFAVPRPFADEATWQRFTRLRERVEADESALADIRSVLAPVETDLWERADAVATRRGARDDFVTTAWSQVDLALRKIGV